MKTFILILAATIFAAASLEAAPISLRERRLSAKTKYKIEKQVVSAPAKDSPDKVAKNASRTIRDSKEIAPDARLKDKVLTAAPKGKVRKNTHVREWP